MGNITDSLVYRALVAAGGGGSGGGITPSGVVDINSNGQHDVTQYATANVTVPPYGEGEIDITSNGPADVSGKATANVNVPPYGVGVVEITANGDHDVSQYATARVAVSGGAEPMTAEAVYQSTRPAEWMPMPTPETDSVYMLIVGSGVAYVAFTVSSADGADLDVSIGTVDASGVYTSLESLQAAVSGSTSKYAINMDAYEVGQIMMRVGGQVSSFAAADYDAYIYGAASMIVDIAMCTPHATAIRLSNYHTIRYAYIDAYGDNAVDLEQCFKPSVTSNLVCVRHLRCSASTLEDMFRDCATLIAVNMANVDTSSATSMSFMFRGCSGLMSLDLSGFNTSNVTNTSYMFYGCSGLTSLDVSNFDTSSVTNMSCMFYGCSGLTSLDVSNFDTSSVTNMYSMFYGCSGLMSLDLSGFNTSSVTNMSSMFRGCSGLMSLDLSGFNTSSVTDMNNMFRECSGLTSLDLSGFDASNVKNMSSMFDGCLSIQKINIAWANMVAVTSMTSFVTDCQNLRRLTFNPDTAGWSGLDLSLEYHPMSVDDLSNMIDSLPTITEAHTISVGSMSIASEITSEMIDAAAAKNWTIDTGAATMDIEPDIPDAQALAIITGEEV